MILNNKNFLDEKIVRLKAYFLLRYFHVLSDILSTVKISGTGVLRDVEVSSIRSTKVRWHGENFKRLRLNLRWTQKCFKKKNFPLFI